MPYTFSDATTQRIANFLNNLGSFSEHGMVRECFLGEVNQQEQARQQRGLMPNGQPKPVEVVPPAIDEAVKAVVHGQTRNERRLARKANGKAPVVAQSPAQPKTDLHQ